MAEPMISPKLAGAFCMLLWVATGSMAGAQTFRELARDAAMRGDNETAVAFYEKALNSAVKVFKEEDLEVVMRRAELGEAYRAAGRWKEAIVHLDYVWKRARYDAETKGLWHEQEGDMAMNCAEKLARACQAYSRYGDALMVLRTALSDNEKAKRAPDEDMQFCALLADNYLLLERDAEAVEMMEKTVKIADEAHAQNPRALARVLAQLGNIYLFHNRSALAKPLYQRAVVLAAQHMPPGDEDRIMIQARLGSILLQDGKLDEAALLLNDSMQNLLTAATPDSVKMVALHHSLSELASKRGQFDEALKQAQETVRLCRLHYVEVHPDLARSLVRLGVCQADLKQVEKAKVTLLEAYKLSRESLGNDNPQTIEAKELLLKEGGKVEDAAVGTAGTESAKGGEGKNGK